VCSASPPPRNAWGFAPAQSSLAFFGATILCIYLLGQVSTASSAVWAAPQNSRVPHFSRGLRRPLAPAIHAEVDIQKSAAAVQTSPSAVARRGAIALVTAGLASVNQQANAIQGMTAGRVPGFSDEIDERGFRKYMRPQGKSGGHGVGWSEIPQYSFDVHETFEEVAVSIADLGGTEIDARFQSKTHGDIAIIVAPVLRFKDIGFNARVTIDQLAQPQQIVEGFAPEVMGNPIEEEDVASTIVEERDGLLYYQFEVRPRTIICATATGNRLFLLVTKSSYRQWSQHADELRDIARSFRVPTVL